MARIICVAGGLSMLLLCTVCSESILWKDLDSLESFDGFEFGTGKKGSKSLLFSSGWLAVHIEREWYRYATVISSPYIDVCFQFSLLIMRVPPMLARLLINKWHCGPCHLGLQVAYLCYFSEQCVLLWFCEITWIPRNHLMVLSVVPARDAH